MKIIELLKRLFRIKPRSALYESYKAQIENIIKFYGFFNPTSEGIGRLREIEKNIRNDPYLEYDEVDDLLTIISWPAWYQINRFDF